MNHTIPEKALVRKEERGEKHVRRPKNFAFSFNEAHLVHKTPITAKSHA